MVTNSVFCHSSDWRLIFERQCKRAQSQVYLNYAECSLSSNDSAKIQLFWGISKFQGVIRADFQQLSI